MLCPRCNQERDEFVKQGRHKGICRKCYQAIRNEESRPYRKHYYKQKQNDPAYKAKQRAARRKYRASAHGRQKSKEYKQTRRNSQGGEQDKAQQRTYYYKHREKRIANARAWGKKNAEARRRHNRKTCANRRNNPVHYLADRMRSEVRRCFRVRGLIKCGRTFDLMQISATDFFTHMMNEYHNKPCVVCKIALVTIKDSHIDHIIPISQATTIEDVVRLNQISNLRLICPLCNMKKGDRLDFDPQGGNVSSRPDIST